ncbi:MAG: response regulator transcription factor [Gammaproteobacteria bacterium]|nr:MAG: response regulator transcription factor [Gammaproteobacteria bacterium]
MRILLIEMDGTSKENEDIQKGLKRYGFTVDREAYGSTLSSFIQTEAFEVILLDLNLSKVSGLSALRKVRAEGIKTPILILTSSKSLKDQVKTFDSGADDYLIKPVDLDELSARIRALQRRYANRTSPLLTHQDIELDPSTFSVTLKGKDISFSRREFSLLQKLLENPGHVVSRTSLNECLYGWEDEIDSNTLEVHVHNIRKKLDNTQLIQTIRGIGYRVMKENS